LRTNHSDANVNLDGPSRNNMAYEPSGVERKASRQRPGCIGQSATVTPELAEADAARAQEYALISALLARVPDGELLHRLAQLPGDASPLGRAHADLARAAARSDAASVEREYLDLFVGLGRGELLPYASFYLTGFLHAHTLARLRRDLAELGLRRAADVAEPEDHAAILCELMSGLAGRNWPAPPEAERALFAAHLAPWIGHFFADLEVAQAAQFYRSVGALGRVYMAIEAEAFALPV
jgi:TorA maturation chaperone TorD